MKKNKGFTMIELLAAIVILGILSTLAIVAVVNLTKKAKEEKDKQNANTLKIAAESYAQANKEYLPKLVGESAKIEIKDLSDNNYIKEDIKNQDDVTCMEKSYVDVTKVSKTEYIYKPYLVCGDETIDPPEDNTNPVIKITINDGTTTTTNNKTTSENIQQANYSIIFKGNDDNKNKVGIVSYNYSLYVKKKEKGSSDDSESFEVFNSGNLLGNEEPEISVSNVSISEYLNITGENEVEVRAFLVNKEGAKRYETAKIDVFNSGTVTIGDTTPPACPETPETRSGEPDDDSWMGKKEIKEGKTRVISLLCNDGQGSGCKRNRFSKTWPSKEEKESKETVTSSAITLTDNAGNSSTCPVKVNIDVESPSLSVLSDSNIKNDVTVEANNNYNDINPSATITSTDTYYNNLHNNWLNQENYPNGIEYSVRASDNIGIRYIRWITKDQTEGEDITDEQLYIDTKEGGNYNVTTSDGKNIYTFTVGFNHDGNRKGTLEVEDNAGNKTTINIEANIDRTPPTIPNVNFYKWRNNNDDDLTTNSDVSELNKYIPNTSSNSINSWSNKKVFTIADPVIDKTSKVPEDGYSCTAIATDTTTTGRSRTIKGEGISRIYYTITDNAGNSVRTQEYVIAIDYTPPTCINKSKCRIGGADQDKCPTWINRSNYAINNLYSSVTIYATCADNNKDNDEDKIISGCVGTTGENEIEVGSTTYNANKDLVTKNAGAGGIGIGVTAKDNAGNETECPANMAINIDITPPPVPATKIYPWKSNSVQPKTMQQVDNAFPSVSRKCDEICKNQYCTDLPADNNCYCASGNNCTWIRNKILSHPYLTTQQQQSDSSGIKGYRYTTTGVTAHATEQKGWRFIEADGESAIQWQSIDKAGNVSAYNKPTVVRISARAANPSCKIDSSNGRLTEISSGLTSNAVKTTHVYRTTATTASGIREQDWKQVTAYDNDTLSKDNPAICGKTYYGYIKVVTQSGITTIKRCSGSFSANSCRPNCSASNPTACDWVTSCRKGNTALYVDHNSSTWSNYSPIYAWAGTAYHSLSGRNDRIYVFSNTNDSKPIKKYGVTWVRVYIPNYTNYYNINNNHFVYIAQNCLGPHNKVCPYSQCPG